MTSIDWLLSGCGLSAMAPRDRKALSLLVYTPHCTTPDQEGQAAESADAT
jgi:hypothetical protein